MEGRWSGMVPSTELGGVWSAEGGWCMERELSSCPNKDPGGPHSSLQARQS